MLYISLYLLQQQQLDCYRVLANGSINRPIVVSWEKFPENYLWKVKKIEKAWHMDLMKTGQFDINETEMYRVRGRTLQRCAVYVGLMCASDDVVQHSEQRIGL